MEYRQDVMGLVKLFHHKPNISTLLEYYTKGLVSTAQPQKHFIPL